MKNTTTIENMINALTDNQRTQLKNCMQAVKAMKTGTATAEEIAEPFLAIPKEDIPAIMAVLNAVNA